MHVLYRLSRFSEQQEHSEQFKQNNSVPMRWDNEGFRSLLAVGTDVGDFDGDSWTAHAEIELMDGPISHIHGIRYLSWVAFVSVEIMTGLKF